MTYLYCLLFSLAGFWIGRIFQRKITLNNLVSCGLFSSYEVLRIGTAIRGLNEYQRKRN